MSQYTEYDAFGALYYIVGRSCGVVSAH